MYCPKCRAEFRDGFSRCGSCDVELVNELPPEEEQLIDDYSVAMTTTDETMLIIAKSLLDAAEVPYLIRGEDILNVFPGLLIGASSRDSYDMMAILVPKEFAEDATEILAGLELAENDYEDEDVGDDEDVNQEPDGDSDFINGPGDDVGAGGTNLKSLI